MAGTSRDWEGIGSESRIKGDPDVPCTVCLMGRGGSEAVKQSLRESLGATLLSR